MKAVSPIIASVIIVGIAISLTSTAYIWGKPLIEKRQEAGITERVYNNFNPKADKSLPRIIEDVANNGGTKTLDVGADGAWRLNEGEDSIEFIFTSKTSNIAADTSNPISLTSGVQCTPSPSPPNGTSGESSSVVCVRATSGDVFEMMYKVWFRELYDNPLKPTEGRKIDLVKDPTGLTTSSSRLVEVSLVGRTVDNVGGVNLITKQIKILLI